MALSGTPMSVRYDAVGDSFRAEKPQPWSPTPIRGSRPANSAYDIHPDGKRLAVVGGQETANAAQDKVVIVFNFFDELRRIAPLKK